MNEMSNQITHSRVNVLKFIKNLQELYGVKFDRMHSTVLENGTPSKIWSGAIGRFSETIASKALNKITFGETKFTSTVPTIPQLVELLWETEREVKRPALIAKQEMENTRRESFFKRKAGLVNGVPQGFGDHQRSVGDNHAKLDDNAPGWRDEAEKIMQEQGGREYARFMLELMNLKLPRGIKI